MKQKAIAISLLVVLWLVAIVAMVVWPIIYIWRGNEIFRIASQAVNALLGGYSRESFSSRMGRTGEFPQIRKLVDSSAPNHCHDAAMNESVVVAALLEKSR